MTTRLERAIARLPQPLADKPKLIDLLTALYEAVRDTDDIIDAMPAACGDIDTAEGVNLDRIGEIVGVEREGEEEADDVLFAFGDEYDTVVVEDNLLLATTTGQLKVSDDYGHTWASVGTSLGVSVWDMCYNSIDHCYYAALANGHVVRITDAGTGTWYDLGAPGEATIMHLVYALASGVVICAGIIEGGSSTRTRVYRSADFGASWDLVLTPAIDDSGVTFIKHLVGQSPTSGRLHYGRLGQDYYASCVYRSDDEGVTWVQSWSMPSGGSYFSQDAASEDTLARAGRILMDSSGAGWFQAYRVVTNTGQYAIRTTDDGLTWNLHTLFDADTRGFRSTPTADGRGFASTNPKQYVTADAGASFTEVPVFETSDFRCGVAVGTNHYIMLAGNTAVWETTNGVDFAQVATIASTNTRVLAFQPAGHWLDYDASPIGFANDTQTDGGMLRGVNGTFLLDRSRIDDATYRVLIKSKAALTYVGSSIKDFIDYIESTYGVAARVVIEGTYDADDPEPGDDQTTTRGIVLVMLDDYLPCRERRWLVKYAPTPAGSNLEILNWPEEL